MDPEERLWFLEMAVTAYLADPTDNGDLAFADLSNAHQYVWLLHRKGAVHMEVGAREFSVQHPLAARAVSRLHELEFERRSIDSDFARDGLAANPAELSWLVEQLFLGAYEVRPDFVVKASFKNEHAARRLRSMIRIAASGC